MTTTGANLRRVTEWVVGLSSVLFLCIYSSDAQRHSETVSRAYVGSNGAVRVVRADGREVVIPKEKEQQGAEELQISDNHKTLGWLVEYPNCCTSYPIPMTVVLYRDGRIIHRLQNGRAIFRWTFMKGGEQVAYFSDSVHSNLAPECVLVDVGLGRTLEDWRRDKGPLPAWAKIFADDVGPVTSETR